MKKNILIIGSGGREHALGWKIRQSSYIDKLFFAPGNAGTSQIGENVDIKITDIKKLARFAKDNQIHLTIVGPEAPLSLGIVDLFQKEKLSIFGPTQKAAELEVSKAWAVDFMKRHKIPHPTSKRFTDIHDAKTYIESLPDPTAIVLKASGLAAGKGVVLPESLEDARLWLEKIMLDGIFGDAGKEVVVQEKIEGTEVSLMALSDGTTVLPLLPAQDHKRVNDNDEGPNTGGMGAYAPLPFVSESLLKQIHETILQPTITGMRGEGIPYTGVLYAGIMLTKDGPKVLEFNARFGDPETQPLMLLLDSDLITLCEACILGTLHAGLLKFKKGGAACVITAAGGYPGSHKSGDVIYGLDTIPKDVVVFHAGTAMKNNDYVTSGGRVLGISAFAGSLQRALNKIYSRIGPKGIHFDNIHFRKDIGKSALTI